MANKNDFQVKFRCIFVGKLIHNNNFFTFNLKKNEQTNSYFETYNSIKHDPISFGNV